MELLDQEMSFELKRVKIVFAFSPEYSHNKLIKIAYLHDGQAELQSSNTSVIPRVSIPSSKFTH